MYDDSDTNGTSKPTLTNVTFTLNHAGKSGHPVSGYGGAIIDGGPNGGTSSPTLTNVILWGDTANTSGPEIFNPTGGTASIDHSVVQGGCPGQSTCTNTITTDPMLGTLGNYGGLTETIPLLTGSSAIDTGDDAVCPATDQRGVSRPLGAHCDIGAFEYNNLTISGNTGLGGVTLGYSGNTSGSTVSDGRGNYTITVPYNWSGTVTPSSCATFNPTSHSYSNLASDQTAQNYTYTINSGCDGINVSIAGSTAGSFALASQGSQRASFAGVNDGPVEVASTDSSNIVSSIRALVNGKSYSEMMGYPANQLTSAYMFPYYNDVDFDSQLRITNVGSSSTTISVYLGSNPNPIDSYTLGAGAAVRKNYAGMSSGPMKVTSSATNILTTIRAWVNNISYSELTGYPVNQLTNAYVFPYYNDVDFDSQLRVSNVGSSSTTINVYLGSNPNPIDSYTLAAGTALRKNYAGMRDGPMKVTSSATNILTTIRAYVNNLSYSELMGYPVNQLTTEYWYPVYDDVDLDSQLRVSNVGNGSTTITVYAGGTQIDSYSLGAGQATRVNYASTSTGPLHVVSSSQPILSTIRLWLAGGPSYYEIMGLPGTQLTTQYWFPWYNSLVMNPEVRIAKP